MFCSLFLGLWKFQKAQVKFEYFVVSRTQDVNGTYVKRLEDVLDVFWTSSERSVCIYQTKANFMDKNGYHPFIV